MKHVLAVDIGASSGRVILGHIKGNKIEIKEIHRFENHAIEKGNHLIWQVDLLFEEIVKGIKKCHEMNIYPESIGIDTWGVDYVLLDAEDERIGDAISYRDTRTENIVGELLEKVSAQDLYQKTGIQQMHLNTIYQLAAQQKEDIDVLKNTNTFLTMPDYLGYLISGIKYNEYTIASTTQLINAEKRDWDNELIAKIGIDPDIFCDIVLPGDVIGAVKKDIAPHDMKLIVVGSHDTASAVVAVPARNENFMYISSGTWALMGVEESMPSLNDKTRKKNFTNEGGVYGTIRLLKNITGMWIIQEVRRMNGKRISYGEYVTLAAKQQPFISLINPDDIRFHSPKNMVEEIQNYCRETDQPVPKSDGALARCIFDSMALVYKKALNELEDICDKQFSDIHIIGGGCQNVLVNQLTADVTGRKVIAGPIEATAIGNLLVQLIAIGEVKDIKQGRSMISHSFPTVEYTPQNRSNNHKSAYQRYIKLI